MFQLLENRSAKTHIENLFGFLTVLNTSTVCSKRFTTNVSASLYHFFVPPKCWPCLKVIRYDLNMSAVEVLKTVSVFLVMTSLSKWIPYKCQCEHDVMYTSNVSPAFVKESWPKHWVRLLLKFWFHTGDVVTELLGIEWTGFGILSEKLQST